METLRDQNSYTLKVILKSVYILENVEDDAVYTGLVKTPQALPMFLMSYKFSYNGWSRPGRARTWRSPSDVLLQTCQLSMARLEACVN